MTPNIYDERILRRKETKRIYAIKHREECRVRQQRYRDGHLEQERKRGRRKGLGYLAHLKEAIFKKLGARCTHCGLTDFRCLQIDHIKGGGNAERKTLGNSTHLLYRKILMMDDESARGKYQILCANCNWIKKHENHEDTRQEV